MRKVEEPEDIGKWKPRRNGDKSRITEWEMGVYLECICCLITLGG